MMEQQRNVRRQHEKANSIDYGSFYRCSCGMCKCGSRSGKIYYSDGKAETMIITDVYVFFDEYDPLMKIWEFSVVDLNGDGELL